jgi:hypothetical protein
MPSAERSVVISFTRTSKSSKGELAQEKTGKD